VTPMFFRLTLFLAMTSAACVAAPITHLVSAEVIEGLVSSSRKWTTVAVMWNRIDYQRCRGGREGRETQGLAPMKTPPVNHSGP